MSIVNVWSLACSLLKKRDCTYEITFLSMCVSVYVCMYVCLPLPHFETISIAGNRTPRTTYNFNNYFIY
jgi:hypothetical protein